MKYVKKKTHTHTRHAVRSCTVQLLLNFIVTATVIYLGEALLAVVFEMFRVDVDVVPVDTVWLRKFGGVLDEFLHLHCRLVFAQLLEGLHRDIGGRYAV